MNEEIDFLVCKNCETPCYSFEVDAKGEILSAICMTCGNEEPGEFRVADAEESGADE
jgi:hypothetical protein